jgi:thiol-disulfide isomerase/thioredoxin
VLCVALLLTSACAGSRDLVSPAGETLHQTSPFSDVHVLMINGGGTPRINYQSHLLHLQQLVDYLQSAGVPMQQVSIFSSDGDDEGLDLAFREPAPDDFWRLRGTQQARTLGAPILYKSSEISGFRLEAATKDNLRLWFENNRERLHAGDTLLLYVTDHGNRNDKDLDNNSITLWGKKESISVRELRELCELLDPGVRIVTLMSQCFSGSFAQLMQAHAGEGLPQGNVCGYFASTAARPAYGCYPENRGRENVGHSFRFLQGLATAGTFPAAHDSVLTSDATPDVPLRTTDVYLEELLRDAAEQREVEFDALVDELLTVAWKEKARWEPEIRLLDRIGTAFGCFSPRSFSEIDAQITSLSDISEQLRELARAWRATLGEANAANMSRFLEAHAGWAERIPASASDLSKEERQRLATELLDALTRFTRADAPTEATLTRLHRKSTEADATAYRMQVRLGALLRMRTVLTNIAGRVHLDEHGEAAQRRAHAALLDCESLEVAPSPTTPLLATKDPFPPFADDVEDAKRSLPAWMGIRFRDPPKQLRERYELPSGAAAVMAVYPDSPAAAAGLEPGDIILGTPEQSFSERHEVRKFTMLSEIGVPRRLDVLRNGEPLQVAFVPGPFPLKPPELPGPPAIGAEAPPVRVVSYRGAAAPELPAEREHLLFFWATWCMPCKASLPELLQFERDRGVSVIAITDEPAEQLDAFLKQIDEFPHNVAIDEFRTTFLAYGVSATPTFVLVGADGRVRSYSRGYSAKKGLRIEGWQAAGEEKVGAAPQDSPERRSAARP